MLRQVEDGDLIRLDSERGTLTLKVSPAEFARREPAAAPAPTFGWGRELFANFRRVVGPTEAGASVIF